MATTGSVILLDYTSGLAENPRQVHRSGFAARLRTGGRHAVFTGMDGAVHQPAMRRPRPLAARRRCSQRPLQQLRLAAAQRTAAAGPSVSHAAAFARQLSAARSASLKREAAPALCAPTTIRLKKRERPLGGRPLWVRDTEVERVQRNLRAVLPGSFSKLGRSREFPRPRKSRRTHPHCAGWEGEQI
jgi:hypothetical protein